MSMRGRRGNARRRRIPAGSAFSLLELALGMAVLALVAGAVTPVAVRYVRQEAGQKTAREILAVLDAGRAFYVSTNRWPTAIAELRDAGHLATGFSQSPFATTYALGLSGLQLQVSVTLPSDVAPAVARLLPLSTTTSSGGTTLLTASATVPGTNSDNTLLLHRQGTLVGSTMSGPLEVSDQSGSSATNLRSLGSNSTNVFEGSVGIGTASPTTRLSIKDATPSNARIVFEESQTETAAIGMAGVAGDGRLGIFDDTGAEVVSVMTKVDTKRGNVGIGTTTPGDKLEIVTTAPGSSGSPAGRPAPLLRLRTTDTGDTHPAIHFQGNRGGLPSRALLQTDSSGAGAETAMLMLVQNAAGTLVRPLIVEHSGRVQLGRGSGDVLTLVVEGNGGNVGIGTMTPASRLHVVGDLAVTGQKNFRIAHPLEPDRKVLVHSVVEGPEAAVYYRGEATLVEGSVVIMLPPYFEALTRKEQRTVQLTAIDGFAPLYVAGEIREGRFTVRTDGGNPRQRFYWEVKAVRADIPPLVVEERNRRQPGRAR